MELFLVKKEYYDKLAGTVESQICAFSDSLYAAFGVTLGMRRKTLSLAAPYAPTRKAPTNLFRAGL